MHAVDADDAQRCLTSAEIFTGWIAEDEAA